MPTILRDTLPGKVPGAFYSGNAGAPPGDIPFRYQVSLGSHAYIIDPTQYRRSTLPLQRQPTDESVEPGEQCVDDETEILTQRGWLTHDALMVGDLAWTLNAESGLAEWQPVQEIYRHPAKVRTLWRMEGRWHSSLTTGSHRWPVTHPNWRTQSLTERRWRTTDTLNGADNILTAAYGANLPTEAKYADAFVELVGWFWTEGNVTWNENHRYIRRVTVAQHPRVNPAKCDRIRACLTRLYGAPGTSWYEYLNPSNGCILFHIRKGYFDELLEVAPGKVVQPWFLAALTQAQLDLFIEASLLGDGYKQGQHHALAQKSKAMADAFQMACVLAGRRTNMSRKSVQPAEGREKQYKVSESRGRPHLNPHANARQGCTVIEQVEHTGMVWCPRTPTETWFARRRGTCYFTGNSLNTQGLWRRSQDNWFLGADQEYLDNRFAFVSVYTVSGETPSVRTRFWRSKGINSWGEGALTLLPATENKRASANTNQAAAEVNGDLYVVDGNEVYWTADPTPASPTWTAAGIQASLAAQPVRSVTTDGYNLYAALGSNGITKTASRGVTSSVLTAGATYAATLVGYANGHLIASTGKDLVEIDSAGAVHTIWAGPTAANFTWDGIRPGPNGIYVFGHAGSVSQVMVITVNTSTGALQVPYTATSIDGGEVVNDLLYYDGVISLATSTGFRACSAPDAATGVFQTGTAIVALGASKCLAGDGEFVWFGTSNYSTADDITPSAVTTSGLGRVDLRQNTSQSVPAWALDAQTPDGTGGTVTSAAAVGGRRYFAIPGTGIYGESSNLVPTGTLETGWIRYGTTEPKILVYLDERNAALVGSVTLSAYDETGDLLLSFTNSVADSVGPPSQYAVGLVVGEQFMVQITLARSGTDSTAGPTLRRWTAKSQVLAARQDEIIVPIRLYAEVDSNRGDGDPVYFDTLEEYLYLQDLMRTGAITTFQVGAQAFPVVVDQVEQRPKKWRDDYKGFEGLVVVRLLTLA